MRCPRQPNSSSASRGVGERLETIAARSGSARAIGARGTTGVRPTGQHAKVPQQPERGQHGKLSPIVRPDRDWVGGFLDAVALRATAWEPLIESDDAGILMAPLFLLNGDM